MTRMTVIISSYNAPERLMRAVLSVRRQTHGNIELIICDDGSENPHLMNCLVEIDRDPNTVVICGDHHTSDEKLEFCTFTNLINCALEVATGDYISYLCDGDEYFSQRCERASMFLDEHRDIDLVWGMVQQCRDGIDQRSIPYGLIEHAQAARMLKERNIINHNSAVHRRTSVRWDTGPDSWLYADWIFWKRLIDSGFKFRNASWPSDRFYVDSDSIGVSRGERGEDLKEIFERRSKNG